MALSGVYQLSSQSGLYFQMPPLHEGREPSAMSADALQNVRCDIAVTKFALQ